MAAKKDKQKKVDKQFCANPFSHLKGFSAFPEPEKIKAEPEPVKVQPVYGSFEDEMKLLGVERIDGNPVPSDDPVKVDSVVNVECEPDAEPSDNDLFMTAVGEMNVRFEDQFSIDDEAATAQPRRLRQLRKGKIVPDQSIDLHGLQRSEVVGKLKSFIANASYRQDKVLLVITGKGLHSEDGKAVLRDEAERFLTQEGRASVVEWGRASKKYGGDGALVLFLRQ